MSVTHEGVVFDRSSPPPPGPVRAFAFPQVDSRVLENGMTLLSAQHGSLPLVTVRVVIDAGAAAERAGEHGLAHLTANALEGGTARRDGDGLAWALEQLGAQLESWTTWDALNVALTTHSDRMAEALALLSEIVREPAFPAREVERAREEQRAEILRRATDPGALADDSAARFIFAEGAPYARTLLGSDAAVKSHDAAAVAGWHARRFTAANSALVIVGAVDAARVEEEAWRAFGGWGGARDPAGDASSAPGPARTTVYIVDRPAAVQSEIRIGHVGVPRHHPDYYALQVMNSIAGGAFTSRLNLNLREKHGFTYGVRSSFAFRRAAGPFVVQTAVASDVTARAVEESLRELETFRTDGPTAAEVKSARDYIAGTLPLQMQTTAHLAARLAELYTFGLPADYFTGYREQINAVTPADVSRVAREHLHLDRLAIVVVGNAAAIEADLRSLGVGDVVRDAHGETAGTGDVVPAAAAGT